MLDILIVGFLFLFALAFVNGANDVGKSVGGLIVDSIDDSKPAPLGKAVVLGALFSSIGSITALLVSGRLFLTFTQDLVSFPLDDSFALAVLVGATMLVLVTSLLRLPVSSTHTIIGAIVFELLYLYGTSRIQWNVLLFRVLLPMFASPFIALLATNLFHRLSTGRPSFSKAQSPRTLRIFHLGSASLTSFSRGINDGPKMAALGFFLLPLSSRGSLWIPYVFVAAAIFLGSITWGRKITESLAKREERLDSDQRLRAGLTTATLVSAGAIFGVPISTTHVAAGANAGAKVGRREVFWCVTGQILLAWAVTFPLAGLLTILATKYLLVLL